MTAPRAGPDRTGTFIRYVLVGIVVFLIDLVTTVTLARYWHYLVANTFAFIVANLAQFAIAHVWVFRRTLSLGSFVQLYPATLSISLLGLACSNVLMYAGVDVLAMSLVLAKIVTSVIVLFINYSLRVKLLYGPTPPE